MTGPVNSQMAPQVDKILSLENTINANQIALKSVSSPSTASALDLKKAIDDAVYSIRVIVRTTYDNGTVKYGLSVLSEFSDPEDINNLAMFYNARGHQHQKTAEPPQNIDPPYIDNFYVRNPNEIDFERYTMNKEGTGFIPFKDL